MIVRLESVVNATDVSALADLLLDAIDSGGAVTFLGTLNRDQAEEWWRTTLGQRTERSLVLVARENGVITGSVQLHAAWAPNQRHRAEVTKLLVHRRSRGAGLGTLLMQAVEREARTLGFTLLTLDAKRGGAAERLYRRSGWTAAGVIPRYALDPDGEAMHDAVLFYKHLAPP